MHYTHGITHPVKIVEENVNFFADYFVFLSEKLGEMDSLSLDNSQSLCEYMLFQIDNNFDNCPEYLKSILSHPIFTDDSDYLNEYKNYHLVKDGFNTIKELSSGKKTTKWLIENPDFTVNLRKFQKELKRKLYLGSVKRIIKLLKEIDQVEAARNEIRYRTSVIVTELIFKGMDKKQLNTLFNQIIQSGDKIGFDNQFTRLNTIFREKPKNDYFLFRIEGLDLDQDSTFKYDQVTFYSKQNKKFDYLKKEWKKEPFNKDFFDKRGSIAVLKLKYFSKELIRTVAVKIIKKELAAINYKFEIDAVIKPFVFLHTPAFNISPGFLWNRGEQGKVSKRELNKIEATTTSRRLKGCHKDFCKSFLMHEYLFDDALQLNSPHAFWHYLEALLTPISRATDHKIVDIITHILLVKYIDDMHWELTKHLFNTIGNDHNQATKIRDKRHEYHNYLKANKRLPIEEIESSTQHPFVNYMVGEFRKLENNINYLQVKGHISRIITDIKAQRNAMIHNGLSDVKRLRSVADKAPNLISRFRAILIETAQEKKELNFLEVFESLFEKSNRLLQSQPI